MVVSRSGLDTACFTASSAFSSPFALPIPICAMPLSCHYSLNICEVKIDKTRNVDQICDSLYSLKKDLIGFL